MKKKINPSISDTVPSDRLREEAGFKLQKEFQRNGKIRRFGTDDLRVEFRTRDRRRTPASSHTVLVQAGPKKKTTTHTLRLEFNPAALGAPGIAFLKTQLESLVPDGLSFADIIANGRVTRVDIAVDLVGVHLADLLVSVMSREALGHRLRQTRNWSPKP